MIWQPFATSKTPGRSLLWTLRLTILSRKYFNSIITYKLLRALSQLSHSLSAAQWAASCICDFNMTALAKIQKFLFSFSNIFVSLLFPQKSSGSRMLTQSLLVKTKTQGKTSFFTCSSIPRNLQTQKSDSIFPPPTE